MAKVTLADGIVIEGTVEELSEMAKAFSGNIEVPEVEIDGVLYRKVTERNPKVGDFVKLSATDDDGTDDLVTFGKYYEIVEIDEYDDPQITDDEGDQYDIGGDTFDVYEKVAPSCPKPYPLKVGDYVKTLVESKHGNTGTDEIVKIEYTDFPSESGHTIAVRNSTGNDGMFKPSELVRATDEEVAEAKRQVEEKTVAEKWARIGRKSNEFKKGDIVRVKRNRPCGADLLEGEIGEITQHACNESFNVTNKDRCFVRSSDVELIAPVESRFDR
ncbi:hypothetical protein V7114_06900 [Neobacillus niacini]|uniref:hypothetical protein n=1 Tax=Neobacillus niacini TaxID=86668 RepID=UPI002FFE91D1